MTPPGKTSKTPIDVQRKIAINAGVPPSLASRMSVKQLDRAIGERMHLVYRDRPDVHFWPPSFLSRNELGRLVSLPGMRVG